MFLIGVLAFTATGCSLFGDDDDDVAASTTVVKTVIKKPATGSSNILGNLKAGIKAQTTTDVVTGAVVTLTLANGSVFTMTDNGNGEYTATVSGLDGAPGFIIEARKGDLLVQNMVTDLANTNFSAPIESNHLTTAFAQVAISAAKVLETQTGVKVATLEDLIKNVTSISIDYSELKRQVTDETNVLYESSRTIATIALGSSTGEGTSEAGSSLLEKIISGNFTDVTDAVKTELATGLNITVGQVTTAWTDTVTTPMEDQIPIAAPVTDKEAIDKAVTTYLNAFLKMVGGSGLTTEEKAGLSAVMTEDFVMNGKTKTVILNSITTDADDLDRFEGGHSLLKVDDNTYMVHIAGTAYLKTGGSIAVDSTTEGYAYDAKSPAEFKLRTLEANISEFPVIIARQSDGSWKVSGNRIKIDEVDIELQYTTNLDLSRKHTQFWLQLEDTTSFPVTSVKVSGPNMPEIDLTKDATLADSNAWHYWRTETMGVSTAPVKHTAAYPYEGWTYPSTLHQQGQEYKFVVTFSDGSTQTFIHTVPQIPSGYAPYDATNVTVNVANNKLQIGWPANTNTSLFDSYYINVWNHSDGGDGRVLEQDITNINTTSAEFALISTSYELIPGKNYSINIHSELKNGLSQHAYKSFTVPDPTEATAVAMSKVLDNGLKGVAMSAQSVNPPVYSGPVGSLRAAVSVATSLGLPSNTMFYDTYTAYAPEPSMTNIFELPKNLAMGIALHLLQFRDGTDAGINGISYNTSTGLLNALPKTMNMLVVVQQLTAGLNMELYLDEHPLINSSTEYHLAFGGNGTVTAQLGSEEIEIRISDSMVDVSKNTAEGLTVSGHGLEASLYQNGQPFKVAGQNVTIRNGMFDTEGLITAYLFAGEQNIGMLSRDETGLKLILLDENGHNKAPIYIQ
ncbi:MAG: hypothetical protein CVV41_17175 [Candidatus Riflebacteria bacterium HGW-Riflebacteria-1]|jgi:hypothetical protein|nr:MAG: hypothetical protein CVV41_17175 [Candidatus Riflebacteria bacterium HGW-Riflebacteria-1]